MYLWEDLFHPEAFNDMFHTNSRYMRRSARLQSGSCVPFLSVDRSLTHRAVLTLERAGTEWQSHWVLRHVVAWLKTDQASTVL